MDTNFKSAKTITLKEIGLNIPVGGGEYLNKTIAVVVGKATGHKIKVTTYGESVCLIGSFMMANVLSGEVLEGANIYLPGDYAESIANALDASEGAEVLIGSEESPLEIVCAESAKAARGYTFIVRQASTPTVVNARKQMAAALTKTLAQLPAPEEAPKKAAKK